MSSSDVGEVEDAVDQAVRWVAEAAQRANHNQDDARALLREALAQDIQQEMKGKQRERKAGATGAAQRLHSDSLRRQAKEADKAGGSSLGDASPSQMERKEMTARMNDLMLEQMREGKQGEVRSLNKKHGIVPKKKNGAHEERSPDKTYHQLLYEEGMLSLEETARWRLEGQSVLSGMEMQHCTFTPRLNTNSRHIMREVGGGKEEPLHLRCLEVQDASRLKRQQLTDVTQREASKELTLKPRINASGTRQPARNAEGGIVQDMERREGERLERQQQRAAEGERLGRQQETFTPDLHKPRVPDAAHWNGDADYRCKPGAGTPGSSRSAKGPAFERLYALSGEKKPEYKSRPASAAARPARKLSIGAQENLVDQLYRDAAAREARQSETEVEADRAARRAAAQPMTSARTTRMAQQQGERRMAAHFDALGATETGLTLPQLYAVLRRLGLLRAAPPPAAEAAATAAPGSPLSPLAPSQRFSPAAVAAAEGADSAEQEALVQLLWKQLAAPSAEAGKAERISLHAMAKFMTSDEATAGTAGTAGSAGSEAAPQGDAMSRTRSSLRQQSLAAKHTDLSSSRAARSHARGRFAAASPAADTPVQPRGLSFSPQLSTPGYSPRSPRSSLLSGRTVFEALYENASQYKQKAETRRISLSEELMTNCTFSPTINGPHKGLTRWESLEVLNADGPAVVEVSL